jgi:hypothetical protein
MRFARTLQKKGSPTSWGRFSANSSSFQAGRELHDALGLVIDLLFDKEDAHALPSFPPAGIEKAG